MRSGTSAKSHSSTWSEGLSDRMLPQSYMQTRPREAGCQASKGVRANLYPGSALRDFPLTIHTLPGQLGRQHQFYGYSLTSHGIFLNS